MTAPLAHRVRGLQAAVASVRPGARLAVLRLAMSGVLAWPAALPLVALLAGATR